MSKTHNAGIVTAYGAAVRGGYTGTYEEFCVQQAQYAENARQMEQAVSDVRQIKTSVESAVSEAEGYANNANQSATNASNSATQASESASNANQSAESASQFANNASNSANSANQSATSAQTSANNASTSEQNARQSAEDAQDILDSVQAEGNTQIGRVQAKGDEVIELIPEDYTKMQTDIQNMSVEISNNGIDILKAFPTDTASGSIATFTDGADDIPVKNLTVNIEPTQDVHGYENPWPAGGGINIWDEEWEQGRIVNGANVSNAQGFRSKNKIKINPNTTYHLHVGSTDYGNFWVSYYDENEVYISTSNSSGYSTLDKNRGFVTPANAYYMRFFLSVATTYKNDISINYPSTNTDYYPYSNICPISGWTGCEVVQTGKNIFGGEAFADAVKAVGDKVQIDKDEKTFTFTRSVKNENGLYFGIVKPIKVKVITVIITYINNGTNNCLRIRYSDETSSYVNLENSNNQKTTIAVTSNPSKNVESITLTYYSASATKVYYDESGVFEGTVTTDDFVPYQGNTINIDWTDEVGTVYGGFLDVSTGMLTVTHGVKSFNGGFDKHNSLSNGYYINNGFSDCGEGVPLCNMLLHANKAFSNLSNGQFNIDTNYTRLCFKSSAFSNATEANAFFAENPLIVAYPLATPIVYQLTPQEVKTILGENNIFADTGDISVEYRADIKKYIDKVVATAISALS